MRKGSAGSTGYVVWGLRNSITKDPNLTENGSSILSGRDNSISISNFSTYFSGLICGGKDNAITDSQHAIIVGGQQNTIGTAAGATFIGGGTNNNITTLGGVIVGGGYNTSSGQFNFIGGGLYNSTTANYSSCVGGSYGRTNWYGQQVHANGTWTTDPLGAAGEAQGSHVVLRRHLDESVGAGTYRLYLDGASQEIELQDGATSDILTAINLTVIAGSQDGGQYAMYTVKALANSTTLLDSSTEVEIESLAYDYDVSVTVSGGKMHINAIHRAGISTHVRWLAYGHVLEMRTPVDLTP